MLSIHFNIDTGPRPSSPPRDDDRIIDGGTPAGSKGSRGYFLPFFLSAFFVSPPALAAGFSVVAAAFSAPSFAAAGFLSPFFGMFVSVEEQNSIAVYWITVVEHTLRGLQKHVTGYFNNYRQIQKKVRERFNIDLKKSGNEKLKQIILEKAIADCTIALQRNQHTFSSI